MSELYLDRNISRLNLMFQYLTLGFVQGLTEFLPVSSSGHLYLLQHWFGMESGIALEVMLHAASLIAVVFYFRKKLWSMIQAFFVSPRKGEGLYGTQIVVATLLTVPTALLIEEFFLYDLSLTTVAWSLIITGGLILVSHIMSRRTTDQLLGSSVVQSVSWSVVIYIGLIQGLAVLPGISRSGLTIAALIVLGISRKKSAEFSFLLSIPTILGALVFLLKDLETFPSFNLSLFLSLVLCTLVSWLTIRFMLQTINRYWIWFMPYCVLLGLGLLFLI